MLHPWSEPPSPPQKAKLHLGEMQEPFNIHFTPADYDQLAILMVTSVGKFLPAAH